MFLAVVAKPTTQSNSNIINRLAVGSNDSTVKIWNLETGECIQTFVGHTRQVLAIDGISKNRLDLKIKRLKSGIQIPENAFEHCLDTLKW